MLSRKPKIMIAAATANERGFDPADLSSGVTRTNQSCVAPLGSRSGLDKVCIDDPDFFGSVNDDYLADV